MRCAHAAAVLPRPSVQGRITAQKPATRNSQQCRYKGGDAAEGERAQIPTSGTGLSASPFAYPALSRIAGAMGSAPTSLSDHQVVEVRCFQ